MMNLLDSKIIEESAGARWLIKKGQVKQARAIILAMGTVRFGPITPANMVRIEAVDDLPRLEALSLRLLDARTWDELLAEEPTV